ncbi:MAG: haloacid dehalogenase type II [Sphingomonas adhaesiva]|uniref:haloacid dehalogenase type II n=1 Tax=Sphingomonas adhaesiva TaxID=28212 RepID=UPI002FFC3164
MAGLRPKYISFDCYGTLIYFEMAPAAERVYGGERVAPDQMAAFKESFSAFRLDEVLGAWKPYRDVVESALRRTCARHGVEYRDSDVERIYAEIPTWNPHPDVVEPLTRVGEEYRLVILSNSMVDLIPHSVAKLGATFHAVFTAEEAQAYKPRMQAFEYMIDQLDAVPEDFLHVSSSFRYDHMTAHDVGIRNKAFVNRGHEPSTPYYQVNEISSIAGLPGLVGL